MRGSGGQRRDAGASARGGRRRHEGGWYGMGGWERGRDGCRGRPILMASLGRGRALHRIGPDGDSAAAPSLLTATALGHTARARHAASKAGPGRAGPGRPPRFVSFLFFFSSVENRRITHTLDDASLFCSGGTQHKHSSEFPKSSS